MLTPPEMQLRAVGRNSQIRALYQFHAAGDGVAVDRRDHGFSGIERAQQRRSKNVTVFHDLPVPLVFGRTAPAHQRDQAAEIGARAESLIAVSRYNCGADLRIVTNRPPSPRQLHKHLWIERIACFGPAQSDDRDVSFSLQRYNVAHAILACHTYVLTQNTCVSPLPLRNLENMAMTQRRPRGTRRSSC